MKRTILLFAVAACASYLHAGDTPLSMSIAIKPNWDGFKVGSSNYIEYCISNTGDKALYISSGRGRYRFFIKDFSGIQYGGPIPFGVGLGHFCPTMESLILLKPRESYTYRDPNPFIISQETNGEYWLDYMGYLRPAHKQGFIIHGSFLCRDYPLEELYHLDEYKDLDRSVSLFHGRDLEAAIGFVYDDEAFRKKNVNPDILKVDVIQDVYPNQKEVQCAHFDDPVFYSFSTEAVIIEVEASIFIAALREHIDSYKPVDYLSGDSLLLRHLEQTKGVVRLDGLDNRLRDRAGPRMRYLLEEGKCRVYDRSSEEYVNSIMTATWGDGYGAVFWLKESDTSFLRIRERIIY